MNIQLRFLGSAALTLALSGAAPPSPPATEAPGACTLITRGEAAAALGAPVPAGTEKAMSLPMQGQAIEAQYCFYGSEVLVARFELGSGAEALFGQYRQSLASEPGYQSVDGVGDEAFAAKGQLATRKGQTGFIVDVGQARGGGAPELEAEKVLAGHAIGRM
jgi:hypothetical protein